MWIVKSGSTTQQRVGGFKSWLYSLELVVCVSWMLAARSGKGITLVSEAEADVYRSFCPNGSNPYGSKWCGSRVLPAKFSNSESCKTNAFSSVYSTIGLTSMAFYGSVSRSGRSSLRQPDASLQSLEKIPVLLCEICPCSREYA